MINEESLNKKAYKNLIILFVCGILLISIDFVAGTFVNSAELSSKNGSLVLLRPGEGADASHINLRADIKDKGINISKSYDLSIKPYETTKSDEKSEESLDATFQALSPEEMIGYELRSITASFNEDTSIREISLPKTLPSGEKIRWSVERSTNTVPLAFGLFLLAFIVYKNRFNPLKKIKKEQKESITRQLPEFINRVVLLLNAGLVLNQAFIMSVEQGSDESDYFTSKVRNITAKIHETNGSMTEEFKAFATECRSLDVETAKELMRISNIFSDNISKGVELTDKLQRESETLWLNRKRDCEERGRIAETKQTLPLTLFLLVLVVITVSPALLEL